MTDVDLLEVAALGDVLILYGSDQVVIEVAGNVVRVGSAVSGPLAQVVRGRERGVRGPKRRCSAH